MIAATLDDLLAVNDEIAALVRAGLPLEQGLAELGRDMPGRLGRIATSLADAASRGEPLEQTLLDRAVRLPPVYRAVMQAGMRAGRLPAALEAVATSARRITDTRRAAIVAVSYPLLVTALVWCGLAVFTRTLAPSLAQSFHSLGVPGERFFAALALIGHWAWYWGPVVPVLLAALVALWWYLCTRASVLGGKGRGKGDRHLLCAAPEGPFRQKAPVPFSADWLLGRLPWMGQMLRWSRTATFLEILALLVENQTPLHEAVTLAGAASGDRQTLQAARQLAAMLENGATLENNGPEKGTGTICAQHPKGRSGKLYLSPFPLLIQWLMLAAGRSGALLPALQHAAATYHRRARHQADLVRMFLPAFLTVVIGGGITAVYALILFAPYVAMLHALSLPK
jgi:general secretion pathway protein F